MRICLCRKKNMASSFNNDTKSAGDDSLWSFMKRNPSIALRNTEVTSINPITAFNKKEVTIFFNNLEQVQIKFKFEAHNIFNIHETGISTAQRLGKILAKKRLKQKGFTTSWERGRNIVCGFSATGIYVSPMFAYVKARKGPPAAPYICSNKGWITEKLFVQYLRHFQKCVKATLKDLDLLVMDIHSTYCTLEAYEFSKTNGIILFVHPSTYFSSAPITGCQFLWST